jgi:hypothetical protein
MKAAEKAGVAAIRGGCDALRNGMRLRCALRLEEEEGVRRGQPIENGGGRGGSHR